MTENWPAIPYGAWRESCTTLQLFSQVVGKYRIAHSPWLNHSWHATLYPTARGFSTGPVFDNGRTIELLLDLVDHRLIGQSSGGKVEARALGPTTMAAFFAQTKEIIAALGGTPKLNGKPNEIPDGVPFAQDDATRPYDPDAVNRFFRAVLSVTEVFQLFRTGYLGKVSPVHLFWGSFDLAVTRFSGRRAPSHPGGIPALPDTITREAYSHEVSSAGFWPGGGGIDEPAFYSYAYPAPEGFAASAVQPDAAYFHPTLGEFILPYEAVRAAADPRATLLAFLQSTYAAAANNAGWDRAALDCAIGKPREPRAIG
ncbi:DUF5996 family protein [Tianweitania sediminis]|uniref:Ava_C0101 and related proteins n=1 Tax=Tianweitania sediminis TaxID=1502156 RepID=A0A8J7QZT1_9HYPH|nr:DUF5996 family protein [Tianweitania sediminis]MBP0437455.1 hypothetical protein [Tianweitania sediminis]